jgi:DNA-directed RNA polymerase specialized sigma24 family protein
MSDDLLALQKIQQGDVAAFGMWAAQSERGLRISLRQFSHVVDVESVVQETLLRVWQVATRIQSDSKPNTLLRFAITTARNVAIDEMRKKKTGEPLEDDYPSLAVEPTQVDPMLRTQILKCKDKLPAMPKRALEERLAARGEVHDEVTAKRLNWSLNALLQNFSRARKLLIECLEKAGVPLEELVFP